MEYYSALKKDQTWIRSNEVDETRVYYTEWSKSERKINTVYTWNLKRYYWQSYLQGSRRDTIFLDTVGEGDSGMRWENNTETYTLEYVKQIASGTLIYDTGKPKPVLCDNLEGCYGEVDGKELWKGTDKCISNADWWWCMAEIITILQSNYSLIKNK